MSQTTTSTESIRKARKSLNKEKDKLVELSKLVEAAPSDLSTYEKLKQEQSMDSLYGRLVTLITRGCSENDIRLKLSVEFGEIIKSNHELIRQKGMMGALMPLLGMIGTITGLMFICSADQTLGGDIEDSFNHKFAGMGTALLTTLYSTLFTAMWFKPRQAALVNDLSHLQKDLELLGHHCLLFKNQLNLNLLHHHHMMGLSPELVDSTEHNISANTGNDRAEEQSDMELTNGS
jgi:flagellar motor component MotA